VSERPVPARFKLAPPAGSRVQRHRIAGRPVGGIARRLEVATESIVHLIPPFPGFLGGSGCSGDSARTDDTKQCFLDCIINAQSAKAMPVRAAMSIQARLQL